MTLSIGLPMIHPSNNAARNRITPYPATPAGPLRGTTLRRADGGQSGDQQTQLQARTPADAMERATRAKPGRFRPPESVTGTQIGAACIGLCKPKRRGQNQGKSLGPAEGIQPAPMWGNPRSAGHLKVCASGSVAKCWASGWAPDPPLVLSWDRERSASAEPVEGRHHNTRRKP